MQIFQLKNALYMAFFLSYMAICGSCTHTLSGSTPRQDPPIDPRLSPPRSSTPKIYPWIHANTLPDHPRQDHPRTPRQDPRHHHRLLTLLEVQPLRHAPSSTAPSACRTSSRDYTIRVRTCGADRGSSSGCAYRCRPLAIGSVSSHAFILRSRSPWDMRIRSPYPRHDICVRSFFRCAPYDDAGRASA